MIDSHVGSDHWNDIWLPTVFLSPCAMSHRKCAQPHATSNSTANYHTTCAQLGCLPEHDVPSLTCNGMSTGNVERCRHDGVRVSTIVYAIPVPVQGGSSPAELGFASAVLPLNVSRFVLTVDLAERGRAEDGGKTPVYAPCNANSDMRTFLPPASPLRRMGVEALSHGTAGMEV